MLRHGQHRPVRKKKQLCAEGMELSNFHFQIISSFHHKNSEQFAMSHDTDIKPRSCQSLPAASAVLCVGGKVGWLSIQASGNISSRDSSLLKTSNFAGWSSKDLQS